MDDDDMEHMADCLHAIKIDDGPDYWPCFVFSNFDELRAMRKKIIDESNKAAYIGEVTRMALQYPKRFHSWRVAVLLVDVPSAVRFELPGHDFQLKCYVDFMETLAGELPEQLKKALARAGRFLPNSEEPFELPPQEQAPCAEEPFTLADEDSSIKHHLENATFQSEDVPINTTMPVSLADLPPVSLADLPQAPAVSGEPQAPDDKKASTKKKQPPAKAAAKSTRSGGAKKPPVKAAAAKNAKKAPQKAKNNVPRKQPSVKAPPATRPVTEPDMNDTVMENTDQEAEVTPVSPDKRESPRRLAAERRNLRKQIYSKPQKLSFTDVQQKPFAEQDFSFQEVKPLFMKGGYSFTKRKYKMPNGEETSSDEVEFRGNLCKYGVSCKCSGSKRVCNDKFRSSEACSCWDENEQLKIHCYVRFHILHDSEHRQWAADASDLTQAEFNRMLELLGYSIDSGKFFYAPGIGESNATVGIDVFDGHKDLLPTLSRNGWHDGCDFTKITEEDRFDMEHYIAMYYRNNTFELQPQSDGTGRRRRRPDSLSMSPTPAKKRDLSKSSKRSSNRKIKKTKFVSEDEENAVQENTTTRPLAPLPSTPDANTFDGGVAAVPKVINAADSPVPNEIRCTADANLSAIEDSPTKETPRFSIPLQDLAPTLLPEFTGTDFEKLNSCLEALSVSNNADLPSFSDEYSRFKSNIEDVTGFLQSTIAAKRSDEEYDFASALYVCGVPGIGKTSGVRWSCNYLKEANSALDIVTCEINAASLVSNSDPIQSMLTAIGSCIGVGGRQDAIMRKLKFNDEKPNSTFLILVVDEVESLVATEKLRQSLSSLLKLANSRSTQMAMIAISNSMNDAKYDLICDAGEFKNPITFSAYSENEILEILKARVGDTIFDPPALTLIAKKVSEGGGGDARRALEMASTAIQLRIDRIDETSTSSGTLVKLPYVLKASRIAEGVPMTERVAGLPMMGQALLCILTEFGTAGINKLSIGRARGISVECMRIASHSDQILSGADFLVILEMLIDMGLLRVARFADNDQSLCMGNVTEVMQTDIWLGTPLEEVEKILATKQAFYQAIRDHASRIVKNMDAGTSK